eukprot:CAMPEP_0173075418 /NCGR_PEP_ID=MMETSP1102-20130122/11638_1 /TAXON_ID=49646 /ORGANISM="Geminigera sp., Strain Caron Lab Isolate" /LENGTH=400 /DNA_ID=CAMNT_0013944749 /DNA_START=80 /DNA_END=1278 /DNA_ORIENTATION=-
MISKLPCFDDIFDHVTLPITLQSLLAPTATRLQNMNTQIVSPAIKKTSDDISLRPSSSTASKTRPNTNASRSTSAGAKIGESTTNTDVFARARQEREQERLGAAAERQMSLADDRLKLEKARKQIDVSSAVARKGRHDIMVARELCRAANEDRTFERFRAHRNRETQGPEALHAQFSACNVKDIVDNVNKHGFNAPQHHRIQMIQGGKDKLARKDEMKRRLRFAGRAVQMSTAFEKSMSGSGGKRKLRGLRLADSANWTRLAAPQILPLVHAPRGCTPLHATHHNAGKGRGVLALTAAPDSPDRSWSVPPELMSSVRLRSHHQPSLLPSTLPDTRTSTQTDPLTDTQTDPRSTLRRLFFVMQWMFLNQRACMSEQLLQNLPIRPHPSLEILRKEKEEEGG